MKKKLKQPMIYKVLKDIKKHNPGFYELYMGIDFGYPLNPKLFQSRRIKKVNRSRE